MIRSWGYREMLQCTPAVKSLHPNMYNAAFPCIPNCVSWVTRDHVIKLETNSFRVQTISEGYSNMLCENAVEGAAVDCFCVSQRVK